MGFEDVLERIRNGDVVMDDYVIFASVCRVLHIAKDVEVLGIISVCHTRVHIPRFIIVSSYAMDPIDYFLLQHLMKYTCARVYDIPAIAMDYGTADKIRKFVGMLKGYLHAHNERPYYFPKGVEW